MVGREKDELREERERGDLEVWEVSPVCQLKRCGGIVESDGDPLLGVSCTGEEVEGDVVVVCLCEVGGEAVVVVGEREEGKKVAKDVGAKVGGRAGSSV